MIKHSSLSNNAIGIFDLLATTHMWSFPCIFFTAIALGFLLTSSNTKYKPYKGGSLPPLKACEIWTSEESRFSTDFSEVGFNQKVLIHKQRGKRQDCREELYKSDQAQLLESDGCCILPTKASAGKMHSLLSKVSALFVNRMQ